MSSSLVPYLDKWWKSPGDTSPFGQGIRSRYVTELSLMLCRQPPLSHPGFLSPLGKPLVILVVLRSPLVVRRRRLVTLMWRRNPLAPLLMPPRHLLALARSVLPLAANAKLLALRHCQLLHSAEFLTVS